MAEEPRWIPRIIEGGLSDRRGKDAAAVSPPETRDQIKLVDSAEVSTETADQILAGDMAYFRSNFDKLDDASNRCKEITAHIKDAASLDRRNEDCTKFSLKKMTEKILGSSMLDWATDPSFYRELTGAYHSRLEEIRTN